MNPYFDNLFSQVRLFRIKEYTQNEYLTVGSDHRIVRWERRNDTDPNIREQVWLVYPIGESRFVIRSCLNFEYVSVDPAGFCRLWELIPEREKHLSEQTFEFLDLNSQNQFKIKEHTRGEYLIKFGSPAFLRRWANNPNDPTPFLFSLEEVSATVYKTVFPTYEQALVTDAYPVIKKKPGTDLDLRNNIDLPPQGDEATVTFPPETTQPVLVAASVVPCYTVDDAGFSDVSAQLVNNCWYYLLEEHQYWDRVNYSRSIDFSGATDVVLETTVTTGFSRSSIKSVKETIERTFSTGLELGFSVTSRDPNKAKKGGTAKLKFGYQYNHSVEKLEVDKDAYDAKRTERWEYKRKASMQPGRSGHIFLWVLVSRFTLKRSRGPNFSQVETVQTWEEAPYGGPKEGREFYTSPARSHAMAP